MRFAFIFLCVFLFVQQVSGRTASCFYFLSTARSHSRNRCAGSNLTVTGLYGLFVYIIFTVPAERCRWWWCFLFSVHRLAESLHTFDVSALECLLYTPPFKEATLFFFFKESYLSHGTNARFIVSRCYCSVDFCPRLRPRRLLWPIGNARLSRCPRAARPQLRVGAWPVVF